MGHLKCAIVHYERAIEIHLNQVHESSTFLASAYSNLGDAYLSYCKKPEANEAYKNSLDQRLENYSENHPALAKGYK